MLVLLVARTYHTIPLLIFVDVGWVGLGVESQSWSFFIIVCRTFEPPLYWHPLPIWPSLSFSLFFSGPLAFGRTFFDRFRLNEILDKHKNKLMWQLRFFIRRLKNNVTCFFIKNTLISNARIRFNEKQLLLLIYGLPPFLQENLNLPLYAISKISNPL